jgi:uncharacterized protein (TIGR02145 family)
MKLNVMKSSGLAAVILAFVTLMSFNVTNDTVQDVDGNTYNTVVIGKQEWLAENLNVSKFRNGDPITQATSYEEWESLGAQKKPAWCYYEFNAANGAKYGKLYNWYAAGDKRGLAPKGWHIPDQDEWRKLKQLGYYDAGKKMKATNGWETEKNDKEYNGTNESGFNAIPAGLSLPGGSGAGFGKGFLFLGESAVWWSAEGYGKDSENAASFSLSYYSSKLETANYHKNRGFSIRCVKN